MGVRVDKMVLRRIFRPKREEVAGGWSKFHNEKLRNLKASPNTARVINSRRLRGVGNVARMGEMRNTYQIFVGKPERKRPLRRPRCRWEDNIRMDLREIEWEVDWIHLVQDRDQ
jgi:hypothetical protein